MIHPTADVDPTAVVAASANVYGIVRENAVIGPHTTVGRNAFIDVGVVVGANCKIQNNALVYAPAVLEAGVFIGPGAIFTNDKNPRAVNPDGSVKGASDWEMAGVVARRGASVGAGAVVLGGVELGEWCMVGAGSVVTRNVATHALVVGVPAKFVRGVDEAGR